jgi:EAL domain-containing protein (putative c-di-GMP-specific phosphodiesterase class I)
VAVLRMQALRDLGVKIAIDDFGTGYSSLNYLRQFPIDILKIDQSFVRGAHEDPEVLALTRSILDLAAGLGLRPVAEGIEVAEELELLRGLGCGLGQGYLFARPLVAEDVLELLAGDGDVLDLDEPGEVGPDLRGGAAPAGVDPQPHRDLAVPPVGHAAQ